MPTHWEQGSPSLHPFVRCVKLHLGNAKSMTQVEPPIHVRIRRCRQEFRVFLVQCMDIAVFFYGGGIYFETPFLPPKFLRFWLEGAQGVSFAGLEERNKVTQRAQCISNL